MSPLPALILAARLQQLVGTWLEVRCCAGTRYLPLRMLAAEHGAARTVDDVMRRLRCERCCGLPELVALVEDPASAAPGRAGAPPGWRVVLGGRSVN
jgi:hypothetical protein